VPECNSIGAAMFGGISLEQALTRAERGTTRTFVVLENDLYRRALAERITQALGAVNLVVLDSIETRTVEAATLVLPTATVAESEGTLINYEGRAQRFLTVFEPPSPIRPAWRWIAAAGAELGRNELQWRHVDELIAACDREASFTGIAGAAPTANYRGPAQTRVPRQPHRYSGRTAMYADRKIHEPKTAVDDESPLAFSMEGANTGEIGALIPYVWAPGWNSNQAVTRFQQEVGGPLRGGDPGVRLIRPSARAAAIGWPEARRDTPLVDSQQGLRMLAVHEIFGSDELSALSPPIRERIPAPYIVLNPDDAALLGVVAGAGVRARQLAKSFEVRVNAAVRQGTAAYPRGLAGLSMPPEWVVFEHDPDFAPPVRIIARQ
jgi:NADH-quinone oxidoreductase subunit G